MPVPVDRSSPTAPLPSLPTGSIIPEQQLFRAVAAAACGGAFAKVAAKRYVFASAFAAAVPFHFTAPIKPSLGNYRQPPELHASDVDLAHAALRMTKRFPVRKGLV